ncbi:ABC transporter ATP-binding protein [Clostridium sp. CF012]|uniref:ABC transporter ATP-binding protein n=1 Tax=Clostridium sp. CF012 TaxID=2843319 RepID=UPI001C0C44C6|nr:ABC transporter ATP-binding protein [Clostridium sp. CF012]MBU3142918.1 ABC transporter ATP-binding protein [Clostridium sp. CF012]
MEEILKHKADYVVTLKDVNLSYSGEKGEVIALQDINLDIKEGEFICVLGPSGCGKSTLLKIIAGFLKPLEGEAKMDNEPISGPDWHRGVVFQSPALYPWLNVQDNVAFGLKMRKLPQNEIVELTNKYLELVGLKGSQKYKPYELSGGMKQRASLARVLVNKPRMILMDEPFGSLDALTRRNMQTLIRKIWTKAENTVFLITHDVDEALALATRIIVMSSGPGTILKEYNIDFTYHISGANHENARYTSKYMEIKEEILNLINSQNEELNFL